MEPDRSLGSTGNVEAMEAVEEALEEVEEAPIPIPAAAAADPVRADLGAAIEITGMMTAENPNALNSLLTNYKITKVLNNA
jgi:hypothetical protein